MSGSCHLDRASNVDIGVECQIFVIFFNCGQVLQFGAHSRYYKGALTQKRSILVVCTTFRSDFHVGWKKSKQTFNTKFVIWCPGEMTWTAHKPQLPAGYRCRKTTSFTVLPVGRYLLIFAFFYLKHFQLCRLDCCSQFSTYHESPRCVSSFSKRQDNWGWIVTREIEVCKCNRQISLSQHWFRWFGKS